MLKTALMLANKILDDHTYTNKTWSEVSGLPVQALNEAEMEFLEGLDFSLHVSQTTFAAYVHTSIPSTLKLTQSPAFQVGGSAGETATRALKPIEYPEEASNGSIVRYCPVGTHKSHTQCQQPGSRL